MSALSGLGAKGEKAKGKFTSININNIYKGTSASTQKSTVSTRQHGLQSLGKVGGSRRMPPPAHLPSLRSENSGNDPNINLVPTGSSGWGTKEEQERLEQLQQEEEQQQPQPPRARPPVEKTPESGGRPQPSSLQQPAIPQHSQQSPQGQKQVAVGGGPPTHGTNIPQQGANTQQTGGNTPTQSNNTNQAGGKSWSSVTMGGNKKAGGFLDQKSPFFQEEFPSLVSGGEEKSPQQKKEEEKEPQYGPGPSLRPQNVGNWKEGGGRGAMQQQQQPQQDPQQNGTPTCGGAVQAGEREADRDSPAQPIPPHAAMMRPGQPMPMGPGGPMIPPHLRGMMPPYMFGRGGFPPGYPPNFHPGMQRPPYPYPDQRFRGPHPGGPPHMGEGRRPEDGDRDQYKRPAIIKDQDLKEFDDLLKNDASDGGWAGAQGEIDYSEKLVFSDDEDNGKDRDHDRLPRDRRDHRYDDAERDRRDNRDDRRERGGRDRRDDDYRRDDRPRSRDSDKDRPEYDERQRSDDRGMYGGPREAWAAHQGQYGRGPMDRQWQGQMPFDQRGPPPGGFPQFRMGPRGPVPAGPGPNQRPGPASPLYPSTSGAPTSPSAASGPPATSPGASPAKGDEEDDMWNKRRRQQNEEMAAAVERARQRREDEERRIELERKAAAQEKLKRLEEKLKEDRALRKSESEKDKSESSDAEHHRSRTGSESSDKGFSKGDKYAQGQQYSRQYTKNMPPRFQKQHGQGTPEGGAQSGQTPVSPQAGQPPMSHAGGQTSPGMRHGPPHWYGDPRAWGAMPPPGYGPGRPIDMLGMPMHPPMRRGRTDSGSDSHDGERRTPDMSFDRDTRLWAERPMPYGPMPGWEEQIRRGGPMPGHPYFDQRGYSGEYEHHDDRIQLRRYDYDEKRKSEDRDSDKSPRDHEHHQVEREYREQRDTYTDRPPSRDKYDEVSREGKFKEDKRERRDSKDSRDSRDSKKDRSDKEDRSERDRPPRPPSDEKHHSEERSKRGERDHRDRRNKDHRHVKDDIGTEGWDDQPTEFHTHNYGPPQGFRGGSFRGRNEWGQQHACPPPISAQRVQDSLPARSNYTSLKRTHSSGSSGERKADTPKDTGGYVKTEDTKNDKTPTKESPKDTRGSSRDSKAPQEDTIPEEKEPKSRSKDERQDSKPQKNKDQSKEDRRKRDDNRKKNDRRDDRKSDRRDDNRDDRRDRDRPPTKRMKDDDRSSSRRGRSSGASGEFREDRVTRGGRGRGSSREFVGRGRSARGRSGYSTVRGRGARGRGEYRSFDGKGNRFSSEGRGAKSSWGSHRKEESDHSEAEDWNEEQVDSRRRTKGEDSDVSVDEASASVSESSSDKINDSREGSKARDTSKEGGDTTGNKGKNTATPSRDVKNPWGVLPSSNKSSIEKGAFPTPETKSELREHMKREEKRGDDNREDRHEERKERRDDRRDGNRERRGDRRDRRENKEYRGDGRYRGGQHQRHDRDGDQGGFTPRGEPSRRGRGSYSRGRGGGRGGSGSAPPKSSSASNVGENKMAYKGEYVDGHEHEVKDNRPRKSERDYRFDRNAPPPRFSRSASGGRGGRGGGFGERGRGGRGRGSRGNNQSTSRGRTKPQLQKQNSSDMGNEEWETASESSDLLDRRDSKNELKDQSGKEKERKEAKKSFSTQRPNSDRQNRRANSAETRNSMERAGKAGSKERSPTAKMNGAGPTTGRNGSQTKANKTLANSNKKENTSAVYRMDEIVLNDPTAVQNAINKTKTSKKSADLSDVSKPLKSEKEKKTDALANIDINNYASVVVIDDQPEVSIDDPTFLFENNEGFQEVTSKKQQKKTIKAAQEEAARQKVQDEKKEKTKKGGKGRGATSSESKRMSKLPPRLAKQRAEKEKEKQQQKDAIEAFMPKIEAWDNELANNIPPPAAMTVPEPPKVSVVSEQTTSTPPITVPYSMGMPTPAPVPAVNAWEKPISITQPSVPVSSVGPNEQVKFDPKADQHDSGIDISEPQNSNSSSTRSSPSAENKLRGTDLIDMAEKMDESNRAGGEIAVLTMKTDGQFDPKPQRQAKGSREKAIKVEDGSSRVVKKPEIKPDKAMDSDNTAAVIASSKAVPGMEPIQLPASFKGFNFSKGEDSSDIKLDFTFDAELAKLTEEKSEAKEVSEQISQPMSMPNQTSRVTSLQSPTSPATEDLNLKIASVKNVWETMPIMPTVFEHSMGSVASTSAASVSVSDAEPVSSSQHFPSFSSSVENTVSVGPELTQQPVVSGPPSSQEATVSVEAVSRKQEMSATAEPFVVSSLSHGQSTGLSSYMDNVVTTSTGHLKTMVSEQSNVCKVKPQLQNLAQSNAIGTNQSMPLQTMGLGSISLAPVTPTTTPSIANLASLTGIPSPPAQQPVIIAQVSQYHPFSALGGSQLMAQETRQFSGYSAYGLSQPPQAPAAAPLAAPAQTSYTQASLFLQTAPTAAAQSDLYGSTNQYRSQYGGTQQPNTIMVSSTSTSTAIKPPAAPSQFNEFITGGSLSSGKSNPLASLQYGQLVNNPPSLQPSGMYLSFDPSQSVNTNQPPPAAAAAPAPTGNLSSSQLISSQLVQPQRVSVQGVQPVQPQSSFYSQQTPLQQTGFYQAQQANPASNLGVVQQVTAQNQYSVQGFGSQPPTGLNLSLQPSAPAPAVNLGSTSTLNKAAAPFKPAAQQHQSASQLKSPQSATGNNSGFPSVNTFQSTSSFASSNSFTSSGFQPTTTTQSLSTKLPPPFNSFAAAGFNQAPQQSSGSQSAQHPSSQQQPQGILTTPNLSQPPPPMKQALQKGSSSQQQFTSKVNSPFTGQAPNQTSGNMLQAQLMMGIRPNTAPPTNQTRFQNPMQRQGMVMPPQQRQTRPLLHQGQQQSSFEPKKSQTAQTPTTISVSSSGSSNFSSSAVSAAGSNTAGSAAFRAQQAKQRAELLAHAQSFLNPNKKPAPKKLDDAPDGVSKESAETSEEKTTSAEESKSETS